ncbi:hypothetical protein ACFFRR_000169 [Megaselia abdita]
MPRFMKSLVTNFAKVAVEKAKGKKPVSSHGGKMRLFRLLSVLAFFGVGGTAYYVLDQIQNHPHERAPFKKYSYLYKRDKPFPWGDHNKSFFHNHKYNALPEGYEEIEEESEEGEIMQ